MNARPAVFAILISVAAAASAAEAPVEAVYGGEGQRNPFAAPSQGPAPVDAKEEIANLTFSLEGLIWESDRPQAIINGKIVEPGADVQGAEVLDIDKKGVKMRYKGQVFILRPRGKT